MPAVAAVLVGASASLMAAARPVDATEVRFPIAVDYVLLQEAVRSHLASGDGGSVWQGEDGCRVARVDDVRIERAGDRLRISARGTARAGFSLFRFCLLPIVWDGYLETLATPHVGPDWQLQLRDPMSQLLDRQRARTAVGSRLWDLVKGRYDSQLQGFTFDLAPPAEEARALIRSSVRSDRAEAVLAALASLRPLATHLDDEGVKVDVVMDVPERTPDAPLPGEPALQPPELERWQATLESFDAFLVFVIKDLGILSPDKELRDDLFATLFDSRQRLLGALAPAQAFATDPVREVFLEAWERLRGAIRSAAARGVLKDRAARYATFVAAGDALAALDAVGPWLGLEISADGLRRMARVLEPAYLGDPLAYSEAPDAALRELFQFHDPDVPDVPAEPVGPGAWWWIAPRTAYADSGNELAALVQRLDRFVPGDDQLTSYRDTVARLLDHVAARAFAENEIGDRFRTLYGHLVRTVAWQESCWRQFVRKNGKVTYLLSSTGDIGIMQVNRRVWRGFFDVEKLRWNVGYNAGAGAEILGQLLVRVGSREAGEQIENAARATYSAYNGGPGSYRRYRQPRVPQSLRAIDEAFWRRYRATAAGEALDYVLCVESWPPGRTRLSTAPPSSGDVRCRSARRSVATRIMPSRQAAIASRPRASCV